MLASFAESRYNMGVRFRRISMDDQPKLSDAEWELVVESLERERAELPVEIRHTRTGSVREALRQREGMLDHLLSRLRKPAAV